MNWTPTREYSLIICAISWCLLSELNLPLQITNFFLIVEVKYFLSLQMLAFSMISLENKQSIRNMRLSLFNSFWKRCPYIVRNSAEKFLYSWTNNLFSPFDIILLCPTTLSFFHNLNSCLLTHCCHLLMWILNYWSILRHHDSLAEKWVKLDTDEQFANGHKEYSFKIAQRITKALKIRQFFSCWIKGPNFLFSDLQLETRILG